jgi:hypothetical protein
MERIQVAGGVEAPVAQDGFLSKDPDYLVVEGDDPTVGFVIVAVLIATRPVSSAGSQPSIGSGAAETERAEHPPSSTRWSRPLARAMANLLTGHVRL